MITWVWRVLKVVEQFDGSTWTETARRKFIWSGWLMLMELEGSVGVPPANDEIIRKYTWGLDLAGLNGQINSLESAGGIGGLVGIYDADATPGPAGGDGNYAVLCDANGNVTQLIAWASTVQDDSATALGNAWDANRIAAHYEYGPYGNVLNDLTADNDLDGVPDAGAYAAENPWRFSTKPFDAETGLGYWGYRYYSPALGRWMSRDPIEERGGLLLYGYVHNDPANAVDPFGEMSLCSFMHAFGLSGGVGTAGEFGKAGQLLSGFLGELGKTGLPIAGLPILRARVIPWGEGQLKPCCDDTSGCGLLFCVEGGIDVTLVLGAVRKPGILDDPRRHTRQQVGFRDRSAYIFAGESLPTCDASLRAGVRAFVRGSAGAGLGYQFNWVVADGHWDCVWPGGCTWTGSWFVNDFQHGAAWGVIGASIEAGITFYASGCFQVASCN
jgi:RHS repeat-associated protein